MADIFYDANDHTLTLSGLRNGVTDAYQNAATVSVTVKDLTGSNVSGQTWPTSMDYVADSDGVYRAQLEDTLELSVGRNYKAHVSIDSDGLQASAELAFKNQKRTG